jgi:Holliday junction resolvase RusA-like endonuclease
VQAPQRWSFIISGTPVPKQRARIGAGRHGFTPEKTSRFEALIRVSAQIAKVPMLTCGVGLLVTAYVPNLVHRDWDNLGKIASDALNHLAYADDSQVVDARVLKYLDAQQPRLVIELWPIADSPFVAPKSKPAPAQKLGRDPMTVAEAMAPSRPFPPIRRIR